MAEQKTAAAADDGIRDGFKQLGIARMLLLGCQHVFAMFGATVLVPLITGFNVSITLFTCGLGTVLYFFITKKKMPVFLGSSFAFIGAALSIAHGEGQLTPLRFSWDRVCRGGISGFGGDCEKDRHQKSTAYFSAGCHRAVCNPFGFSAGGYWCG